MSSSVKIDNNFKLSLDKILQNGIKNKLLKKMDPGLHFFSKTFPSKPSHEIKLKGGSKCNCCPYGYHIDRDFVRYCESLYNSTNVEKLKQLKKEKRRQCQPIEAYLGLTDSSITTHDSKLKPTQTPHPPPPDLLSTSDALRDAVLDFEETLQSSQKNSSEPPNKSEHSNFSKTNSFRMAPVDLLTNAPHISIPPGDTESASVSVTSSSQSSPQVPQSVDKLAAVTSDSPCVCPDSSDSLTPQNSRSNFNIQESGNLEYTPSASQQMADTMATLTRAGSAFTSTGVIGINRSVLTAIREQMATSLHRMRELEEQVKEIPVLKVQLSVLNEEKRLLIHRLKSKINKLDADKPDSVLTDQEEEDIEDQLRRLENGGILTPRLSRKLLISDGTVSASSIEDLSAPGLANTLSTLLTNRSFVEELLSQLKSESDQELSDNKDSTIGKRKSRHVGTHCTILTRDVGVSHVPERKRSVGVGDNSISNFQQLCTRCNKKNVSEKFSLSTTSDSLSSDSEDEKMSLSSKSKKICFRCRERSNKQYESKSTNTAAEQLPHRKQVEKKETLDFDVCNQVSILPQPQICQKCESYSSKRFRSVGTDNSQSLRSASLKSISVGVNTDIIRERDSISLTDLRMTDIISVQEIEAKKKLLRNRGTDCIHVLQNSVGIQISPIKTRTRDSSTACDRVVSYSTGVQVEHSDYYYKKIGTTIDAAVGDSDINVLPCNKCKTSQWVNSTGLGNNYGSVCKSCTRKKLLKSIGVGESSVTSFFCDKCKNVRTRTIGSGSYSVNDTFCDKCELRQTETVGVGDYDIYEVCKHCVNKQNGNISLEMHSVGVNATLDSSSTLSLSSNLSTFGMRICDKCNATIQSVAEDFVERNVNEVTQSTATSRIPRLNSQATVPLSSVTETKKANVQASVAKQSLISQVKEKQITKAKEVPAKPQTLGISFKNPHARLSSLETSPVQKKATVAVTKTIAQSRAFTKTTALSSSDSSIDSESDSGESQSPKSKLQRNISSETVILDTLHSVPHEKTELSKEIRAACKVLNDYLMKPERGSEKKISSSLNLIQLEWFKVGSNKDSDAHVVEDYLDAFEEFSKNLLYRVVNMTDGNGNTVMHYAVSFGNFDIVSILLDSKVWDVNKQNKAGYTCIMLVSLADIQNETYNQVVKRLFQLGDVNIKAIQNGQTALMLAVSHGRLDTVKMLLDAGAAINLQDNDGSTALMCAAEHGHIDIVRELISHPDCDPSLSDNDGSTALTVAMEAGNRDVGLLIYASMNFSRGTSPYSSLKSRRRGSTARSTPQSRTPPPPSPSLRRSTSSIPQSMKM